MYREHPPPAALAPYVSCFWERESRGKPHRVLPDGAMDVLYFLGEGRARVIGTMTRAIVSDPGKPIRVVGVRFRPGAAIELLGLAARELRDNSAAVVDVWGTRGRSLDARLADAHETGVAIEVIRAELMARVATACAPDPRIAAAVAAIRATGGELPIPAVARRAGIGERQLERLFGERVGYGPKVFARVARLERVTQSIELCRGSIASWASLAIDCGYTDQAHLVREFRALTGTTPRVFARSRTMSEIDNP